MLIKLFLRKKYEKTVLIIVVCVIHILSAMQETRKSPADQISKEDEREY